MKLKYTQTPMNPWGSLQFKKWIKSIDKKIIRIGFFLKSCFRFEKSCFLDRQVSINQCEIWNDSFTFLPDRQCLTYLCSCDLARIKLNFALLLIRSCVISPTLSLTPFCSHFSPPHPAPALAPSTLSLLLTLSYSSLISSSQLPHAFTHILVDGLGNRASC